MGDSEYDCGQFHCYLVIVGPALQQTLPLNFDAVGVGSAVSNAGLWNEVKFFFQVLDM